MSPHPSGLWLGIDVTVRSSLTVLMILDSGSPLSAISPALGEQLLARGLARTSASGRGLIRLTHLSAEGNPLPELNVRILARLSQLRVDGLLGLNFFGAFELTCFRLSTSELLLEYPAVASA